MTKKYKFNRKFNLFISIFAFILFGLVIGVFATKPEFTVLNQNESDVGTLLLIFVIIVLGLVSFFPAIMAATSFLRLEDGILSRIYLGIRLWSIKVSEITDIYRGNLVSANYSTQLRWGLTFRIQIGEKKYWKTAPQLISDEGQLILDLTNINQDIKLHDDPADLRKAWGFPL